MIVLLRAGADVAAARAVEAALQRAGAGARRVNGGGRLAVESVAPHAPLGDETRARLAALDGVEAVLDGAEPNPRVRAARGPVEIATPLGPLEIGGAAVALAFGPCSVDDEDDLWKTASAARAAGAQLLRGGAFKPRTSPYAFQGAGAGALRLLRRAGDAFGLAVVSEAMSEASLDAVAAECELVQLGARSMACTPLLKAAARCGRPLLLKRGFGATVDEWLAAAEYLLDGGAPGVILCERGIRTFEPGTRATLDLGGLALARLRTGLPIFVDPSHAAGTRALVEPLSLAALAAGADGLIVECHADPGRARSDGPQALALDELEPLARACHRVARAVGREIKLCSVTCPPTTPSRRPSSALPR
ncbi:MAG TPA: 3-deoxy-7-phosphoheptulonate synthase [Polyangia bacterium]|nr:3-deoxy-7-phosphoheptulonate synthase [Polyangia bacterium]